MSCTQQNTKSLNVYFERFPLDLADAVLVQSVRNRLPPGTNTLVRPRLWESFYDVMYFGVMVGYDVIGEHGGKIEVLTPYEDFNMADVPWEEVIL